jgi:2-polyprenyl-3-methyl-5-hydroxy-6-metoxy-1,4-benzoquinol methylase
MKLRYSKNSNFYKNLKGSFFEKNETLLNTAIAQNKVYISQPHRSSCKICGSKLPLELDFSSHGVDYVFCSNCTHLNGLRDDTLEYVNQLYINDSGDNYSKNYVDSEYEKRLSKIYVPKAEFLSENMPLNKFSVLDVGCGAGYFVGACKRAGIDVSGIDVSESMVGYGNFQLKQLFENDNLLGTVDEDEFNQLIINANVDVISVIGVIEHLRNPLSFFESFKASNASHLLYSVPMFSSTVIFENIFQEVFPRQLSGGHTHLFTEKSLDVMHSLLGAHPIAQWRFGSDFMDLYRAVLTMLSKSKGSEKLADYFSEEFLSNVDNLQEVLDRSHFCSEIHCLLSKD